MKSISMCYFLSIGIPARHSDWAIKSLSKDFEIWDMMNPSFCNRFGPNENAHTVTTMGCSCNLYHNIDVPEWTEHERAKRRKKGWSEAKISRSIEQKLEEIRPGLQHSILRGLSTLYPKIERLTLAVHWYDEDLDKERVQFAEDSYLSIVELLDDPARIRPDVIYRILSG
ncbi:MAG: hypothetical protein JSW47_01080 [Phycisphaerales bacterium]|nr:MAG: hypothetical protein JSW47_01080 [Phycisphaerales bacterium]